MGFSSVEYNKTVQNLTNANVSRLDNPYWRWSQSKPTVVTYWNLNTKKTTLGQGNLQTYDQLGNKSSLRYNKINGFVLYGLPRFNVDLNLEEDGVQSSPIEGEAIILPNTIIPSVDDYFTIDYVQGPYVFRITKQTPDMLENSSGIQFYKISFELDNTRPDWLESLNGRLLAKIFYFDMARVGTNMTPLLTAEEKNGIDMINQLLDTMMTNYKELFWQNNVQAFICPIDGHFFCYDPYITFFIIQHDLFYNNGKDGEWIFVDYATHKPRTFSIEYANTIFSNFDYRNPKLVTNSAYPLPVHDPNSMLTDRLEQYFELSVNIHHSRLQPINQINMHLFDRIQRNDPFDENDTSNPLLYWNILINWINNEDYSITEAQLNSLANLEYMYSKDLFYHIPLLMYVLKSYLSGMQKATNNSTVGDNTTYLEKCYNTGK